MKRFLILSLLLFSTACGQLITPEPSPIAAQVTPTPTPTGDFLPTVTARPTSTPKPATPAPTPTPTMTPTPILYTVQPGDTLLGIAIDADISAEAIQVANGIIDPRSLQIGQILVIPNPEEDSDQPNPTATPFPATVQGINFLENPENSLWCFGEVVNPGDQNLSEIVVSVSLFDAEGKLLASEAAFTALDILPVAQSVPFAIHFEEPPSSFAQYQVSVVSAVPLLGETRYYFDLSPAEISATQIGESTFRVSGELENTGSGNVEAIKLLAIAYDDANRVVAQRQVTLDVIVLRSQARTPFEIDLTAPSADVSRYAVLAQGLRAE